MRSYLKGNIRLYYTYVFTTKLYTVFCANYAVYFKIDRSSWELLRLGNEGQVSVKCGEQCGGAEQPYQGECPVMFMYSYRSVVYKILKHLPF